jgi:type IV pilus assembly protein PilN
MRIAINLASRPFVELRPLFAKLRLAMAALALLAVGLGFGLHVLTRRAAVATAQMNQLKAKTASFEQERQRDEARMRQPQNRAVLDRSLFLNELFARKSFSWTAVMMDLERVLPNGVQVTSIEPRITKEGDVSIRLRVSGDRDQAVQLVRNLERSQRFLTPRLASETAQTSDGKNQGNMQNVNDALKLTGVEFDILSEYNPLPATLVVKAEVRQEKAVAKTASGSSKTASGTPNVPRNRKPAVAKGGRP